MSLEEMFDEFLEEEEEKPKEKPKKEKKPKKEAEEKPKEEKKEEKPERPEEKPEEKVEEKKEEATDEFFEVVEREVITPVPKPLTRPEFPEEVEEEEFVFEEDKGTNKRVYMIYGMKGHGKTALAFSFQGTIACLSFDKKSLRVKEIMYSNDSRIKVYDAVRYMDYSSPEKMLETAAKTFRYVNWLLDKLAEDPPDWIVIDGTEIFERICEYTMRYRNNLMPFQGIANRNLWKERRMYIKQVHDKALRTALRGVIYTAYTDIKTIYDETGEEVSVEVPKWIDAIEHETDVVIKVKSKREKDGQHFYAIVESSKAEIPTGIVKDITNKGIEVLMEEIE